MFNKQKLIFNICILYIFLNSIIAEDFVLPNGIKTCPQDDPDLNQCLKNTIQEQIRMGYKENKELNIPVLDPWSVSKVRIERKFGDVEVILIGLDVKMYGFSKTIIQDIKSKISDDGMDIMMKAYYPNLLIDGNYKANVKINELKIRPKGHFNLTMTNVTNNAKLYGIFEKRDGKRFFRLKNFDVSPDIGFAKFNADGLFPDPALNDFIVAFVNQYFGNVYKDVLRETRTVWEPLLLDSANAFFTYVPFDKLITSDKKNEKD